MIMSEEFKRLWHPDRLPERIRAGNYAIHDYEKTIIEEYIKSFYNKAEEKGVIDTHEYTIFMDIIDTLWRTNDEVLQGLVGDAMLLNSKLRYKLENLKKEQ